MRKYLYCLFLTSLLTSCYQQTSQVERDYIKNLEEKNRILETELKELKSKSKSGNTSSRSRQSSTESNLATKTSPGYFTIGSTEDEVLLVMGDPTSYNDLGSAGKLLFYGNSSVHLENGRVESYDNLGRNLKVRVRK